jgi:2-C-methyl-D-erythritol 4-phosphate cytidylyltransferase
VEGGTERQESVARGLEALPPVDVVAVHDAARPFATAGLLAAGTEALRHGDAAIPVQPIHDTVKRVDRDGMVIGTVDRAALRAAQTPQVFRAAALREVHERVNAGHGPVTDDASMLERAGYRVVTFLGLPENLKITTDFQLSLAQLMVKCGLIQ